MDACDHDVLQKWELNLNLGSDFTIGHGQAWEVVQGLTLWPTDIVQLSRFGAITER